MRGVWSIPVSTLLLVNEAHPLAEEPPAEELLPVDSRFPEVPKVKTDIPVLKNEIVAIVLMYGDCNPYIIGRCF